MFKNKIENIIKNEFSQLFIIDNIEEEIILHTPLFLNDGSTIYIYLKQVSDFIVFSNDMYKYITPNIEKFQKNKNILKDYFLNKKNFEKLIKNIEKEGIEHSLLLEKKVHIECDLVEEIAKYLFSITKFYNYIYDYALIYSKDKESKAKEFRESINKFVSEFNKLSTKKIKKIEDNIYSRIDYYEYDNIAIFTGIHSELDLYRAYGEMRKIVENDSSKKAMILVDNNQKSLVKETQEKFLKIYPQEEIQIIFSKENYEISEDLYKFIGIKKL